MTPLQKKKLFAIFQEITADGVERTPFEQGCEMALRYSALGKKQKKEADECYQDFVETWTKEFPELGFNKVAGAKIKSMIDQTRKYVQNQGKEATRDQICGMFQYVIAYVKRERHWCLGKDITTFDSKYLSIIYEIKNGRPKQTSGSHAFDYVQNLS